MPTVTGIDPSLSLDFAVRPKKDGKKPAGPFAAPDETAQPDARPQTSSSGAASPLDPMSMETFLALLDLGAPAKPDPNAKAADASAS